MAELAEVKARQVRVTALVVLISIAVIVAVIAVGQRDASGTAPSGSPFVGQGSPVEGSPFEGQGSPVSGESFSGTGTPVGMIQTMGWKPNADTGTGSVAFTAQATAMTAAQMQQLGLAPSKCTGTYWTWRQHFRSVRNGVLFYEFGPINYWCGGRHGNVNSYGWINKLGSYGGVYAFKGGSRSHTPFGYPSIHVFDQWHYHLTKADDDRYPDVDYDLFANGGVSGVVHYG